MDNQDCLAYPFVVVRIACRVCARRGSYRLARLAAKFGPEVSLRDLTDRHNASRGAVTAITARAAKRAAACRPRWLPYAARLATLAIVARLQPVAAWIADHDMPERSIPAMPALRSVSSGRPR
jgi:hypothetical protein